VLPINAQTPAASTLERIPEQSLCSDIEHSPPTQNGPECYVFVRANAISFTLMIALIQRVTEASVRIEGQVVGAVGAGILALIGVRRGDDRSAADRLLERLLGYRIFPDEQHRMNLSLRDIRGGLLLVPQFTLAADTQKGTRPGFSTAAAPEDARELFSYLLGLARGTHPSVAAGVFGADMRVSLVNDGPVTFWLEARSANVSG
jgi:D-tyrosyl-tRNA(Tyr) deacylase